MNSDELDRRVEDARRALEEMPGWVRKNSYACGDNPRQEDERHDDE